MSVLLNCIAILKCIVDWTAAGLDWMSVETADGERQLDKEIVKAPVSRPASQASRGGERRYFIIAMRITMINGDGFVPLGGINAQ